MNRWISLFLAVVICSTGCKVVYNGFDDPAKVEDDLAEGDRIRVETTSGRTFEAIYVRTGDARLVYEQKGVESFIDLQQVVRLKKLPSSGIIVLIVIASLAPIVILALSSPGWGISINLGT